MNRKGFTLVELIVVITILAVLWTISFVSLQWYASEARDSKRVSDLNSIRSILEYDFLKKGYYDLPENGLNITYSTWWQSNSVWQQWYFGEKNRSNLWNSSGLSKVPKDPLTNTFYSYSILNTKKEIQVGAVLEWWAAYNNFLNETYAEGSNIWWSYIIWNYNWKIAKVTVWSNIYLFALPSITSSDLSVTDLTTLLQQNKLSYNGTTKLPWSYQLTSYILNSWNDLIVNNVEQPVTTL